jgi:hypothetical protein
VAHDNRVLRSINNDDASRCVDVFLRPEGTIGSRNIGEMPKTAAGGFRLGPILRGYLPMKARRFVRRQKRWRRRFL